MITSVMFCGAHNCIRGEGSLEMLISVRVENKLKKRVRINKNGGIVSKKGLSISYSLSEKRQGNKNEGKR